jgi:hypothetical protein
MSANALAQICVVRADIIEDDRQSELDRETQLMGMTRLILTAPTGHPEHPGRLADYIGSTDFDVDIQIDDDKKKFHFSIQARPFAARA